MVLSRASVAICWSVGELVDSANVRWPFLCWLQRVFCLRITLHSLTSLIPMAGNIIPAGLRYLSAGTTHQTLLGFVFWSFWPLYLLAADESVSTFRLSTLGRRWFQFGLSNSYLSVPCGHFVPLLSLQFGTARWKSVLQVLITFLNSVFVRLNLFNLSFQILFSDNEWQRSWHFPYPLANLLPDRRFNSYWDLKCFDSSTCWLVCW